jgi:hypothetical protein
MSSPKCKICGNNMRKNGNTKAGTQRWRCSKCGYSTTRKIDTKVRRFKLFLNWLLSKKTQEEMGYSRAKFKRLTHEFWNIWPIAFQTGELFETVYLDGIWIKRNCVVLIACSRQNVIAWHLAKSENSAAWAALMSRIPAPTMLVSDGAPGLAKATRQVWPQTKIQRCVVHIFWDIKSCTTTNPKLEAGKELLEIGKKLLKVKNADQASEWIAKYVNWTSKWENFLGEFTFNEGKRVYVHERLRKARRTLNKLVQSGQMFTFIDLQNETGKDWDSTNNVIEGRVNAQLRQVLRNHRGLSAIKRIKSIFWWCYLDSGSALSPAEILRVMPTDDEVEGLFAQASKEKQREKSDSENFGVGIDWNEFHMPTEFRQ